MKFIFIIIIIYNNIYNNYYNIYNIDIVYVIQSKFIFVT